MTEVSEQLRENEQNVSDFYDTLAPDYDLMTGFEKRFVQERPFFRVLVERFGIRSALDAGCGSGFHSLLLADLGVDVTSVDVSRKMLNLVRRHAKEMRLNVRVVESSFHDLCDRMHRTYDAVFCLGNSLAHILSEEELLHTLRTFARVLKPGGILFLQNLNYDRILNLRERIQSAKEVEGVTFVRYYEYTEETIVFNILTLKKDGGILHHDLNRIQLRPIIREELLRLLVRAGFVQARAFGGITMEEFIPEKSRDLVVLAHKP
jgi:2-polyprenyl-3-methyl-5-hydroxy-6-metoxy-1,4-benzoquinol methylase